MRFQDKNWTDDIPSCPDTGIGVVTNHTYKEHGFRQEKHENEDRCFFLKLDEDNALYGIFDGHMGSRAAVFAAQQFPSEIIFNDLYRKECSDSQMKRLMRQAFSTVEQSYFDSLSGKIAERDSIRMSVSHEPDPGRQRTMATRQSELDEDLSSGCTAMVALLLRGRIYLAHVGNCRALLCRQDSVEDAEHRVQQLTSEHTTASPEERTRLAGLGLTVSAGECLVPGNGSTRCIGDHRGKGDFRQWPHLAQASAEPLSALPQLVVGLEIDPSWRFLLLATKGLCDAVQEVIGSEESVNAELVKMVIAEANTHTNLHQLAQAVVDNVVRLHHQCFISHPDDFRSPMHEDLTLLVRRFEAPETSLPPQGGSSASDGPQLVLDSPIMSLSSLTGASASSGASGHILPAYVDWGPWERAMSALTDAQREDFRATLSAGKNRPRPAKDKIEEESEPASGPTSPVSAPPGSEHRRLTPLPDPPAKSVSVEEVETSGEGVEKREEGTEKAAGQRGSVEEESSASSSCYVDGDM